jgi:aryl-phospho-beta-D-glucosidase BglC (GH1 family)
LLVEKDICKTFPGMKKKMFSCFVMTLSVCLLLQAQPVKQFGQLQVKGTQLCNAKGNPVVLRGMSLGWHNWWPRFYNAGTINWLHRDWNATVVRAAMGVEPKGGYISDPTGSLQKVKAVVDAAIKEGIYVIIDWHSHNIRLEEAKTFFTQMAKEYGKHPHVIYEIFNEPERQSWEEVKAYSEEVIRQSGRMIPTTLFWWAVHTGTRTFTWLLMHHCRVSVTLCIPFTFMRQRINRICVTGPLTPCKKVCRFLFPNLPVWKPPATDP